MIKPIGIGLLISLPIILVNFLVLKEMENIFYLLNILSIFLLFSPLIILRYLEHKRIKEMEEMFHVFLRDFVQAIRSGMSLPVALKTVSENDYKSLSPYIKKLNSQLDWGIPFEKALLSFSRKSKSKLIGRIVSSVIESHRFGGNLSDTLESLRATALETEKLRAERRLYMHSQMITGYIIYFVFIAVIIGLKLFLLPSLTESTATEALGVETPKEELIGEYGNIFRNIILIQGLFAGLSVGKMSEGALIAGIKHSIFMIFVGLLAFILTS
ncbi:MAG: type II secretion system F family protein [Candidatus Aenigmatarchaeota archaeon]